VFFVLFPTCHSPPVYRIAESRVQSSPGRFFVSSKKSICDSFCFLFFFFACESLEAARVFCPLPPSNLSLSLLRDFGVTFFSLMFSFLGRFGSDVVRLPLSSRGSDLKFPTRSRSARPLLAFFSSLPPVLVGAARLSLFFFFEGSILTRSALDLFYPRV